MNFWSRPLCTLAVIALCAAPLASPAQEPAPQSAPPPAEATSPPPEPASAPPESASPQAMPAATPEAPVKHKRTVRVHIESTADAKKPADAAPTVSAPAADATEEIAPEESGHLREHHSSNDEVVAVGSNAELAAGDTAEQVVSVFGSSTSAGEVSSDVVSVFGDTRVTGPVGDGAVAIFGNLYIDSKVSGDAVAVFGNVELGPHAEVQGETVIVGGVLKRDPAAITHGTVNQVIRGISSGMQWLRPWIQHCLLLGRPLAIAPGLGWAWGLALGFLVLYMLLAVMFQSSVERCMTTLEESPGRSILASLLAALTFPIVIVILCVTGIGILLVPVVYIIGLFGKAAVIALIGRRLLKPFGSGTLLHPAIGVLVGSIVVLALYLVPFVGFIVSKLLGILGLGVVAYTLILISRASNRAAAQAGVGEATSATAASGFAPEPAAASVAAAQGAPDAAGAYAAAPDAFGAATAAVPPVEPMLEIATLERAGFWVRMGALFIDTILIGVALSLVHDMGQVILIFLATYGAIMWKLKGTTVGGIVFNLKVMRIDGRRIDWTTAIVRALGCFLSMVMAGLGFIWIIFDDEKQAWHDKIAGTVVVRMPKGVSLV